MKEKAILDSGASVNFIKREWIEVHKEKLQENVVDEEKEIKVVDGSVNKSASTKLQRVIHCRKSFMKCSTD